MASGLVSKRGRWALLVLAALAVTGCHKQEAKAPAAPPAAEVGVVKVTLHDVPLTYEFVGETQSSQQVEIRARVSGFLEQRLYTEGSMVKAGQVMFRMDQKPFQAALDAAQAELAQQQARLTTARSNLARVKPLAAKNALSQKDLDEATGQEQAAAAAVEAARANVTNAKLNLGYTTITSPVDGLSSYAKKQVGSYIDATNSLLTYVAKLDPIWINFSLSENEVLQYQSQTASGTLRMPERGAMEVEIVLADGTTYPQRGRIAFADASFNSETGTYLIRAEMPNTKGMLRPGQFVRVRLIGAVRTKAITVPQEAVVQGQRGQSVWLVGKENKAESRVIDVGEWSQGNWVVRSGLREGDTVIVDGAIRLAPGAPVKPVAAAPRPASDGPSPVPPSAPPARPAAPGAPGAAEAGKGAAS
ncbi:membrane fusion protein, multidrug efflux system [Ralstonia sp. 25mfcol4.1]|uniref:efflux RND transporter periplasmic adaptor subunit n=1 Tax=Burkholderiaceae TaxID=119060 RepID=UPI0008804221|nr:efflux RND transporter periplasmic adaptor subunit [Ralstonia sp. 25mfcol4.1]SDP34104.1 membrane fusion protein, multidrug efflux system [Ralstonia sp. 25mfcol4.1]